MAHELSLFGDDAPEPRSEPTPAAQPIADWQIDLLRKALDARGLTSMSDRQRTVEAVVGLAVESLRSLTREEGLRVLPTFGRQTAPRLRWSVIVG